MARYVLLNEIAWESGVTKEGNFAVEGEALDGIVMEFSATLSSQASPESLISSVTIQRGGENVLDALTPAELKELHAHLLKDTPTSSGSSTSAYLRLIIPIRLKPSSQRCVLRVVCATNSNVSASRLKFWGIFVPSVATEQIFVKEAGIIPSSHFVPMRGVLNGFIMCQPDAYDENTLTLRHNDKNILDSVDYIALRAYQEAHNISYTTGYFHVYDVNVAVNSSTQILASSSSACNIVYIFIR
jgi:hypothetical protein